MTFSLNEVEATSKKATRGAGYSWGLAEEAGKATRWLCARELDGCGALATLLTKTDGIAITQLTPDINQTVWLARGGFLCAVMTGCCVSDLAERDDPTFRFGRVVEPLLLLPFVAAVARVQQCNMRVSWPGGSAVTDGEQINMTGIIPDIVSDMQIEAGGVVTDVAEAQSRVLPDPAVWARLHAFAHRTYAPATEESRRKGAG
jgi:hypothetical protein